MTQHKLKPALTSIAIVNEQWGDQINTVNNVNSSDSQPKFYDWFCNINYSD